jgi:hypothetical protein
MNACRMPVSQFIVTFWLFFTTTENFTLDHQVDGVALMTGGVGKVS